MACAAVRVAAFAGCVGWLGGWGGAVVAAPLDALIDLEDDPRAAARWTGELSAEVTQPLLDALGVERRAARVGLVRLHRAEGPWSFTLGAHQRHLQDQRNAYQVQSWHAAVQVEPGTAQAGDPWRWGLRLSAWGDRADHLLQSSNASLQVSGLKARLTEMELVRPRDQQWQLDAVGRATLADVRWSVSGFAGVGSSRVTRSLVRGQATISDCAYDLQFTETRLNAVPLPDCPQALQVSVPNALLAVDVLQASRYQAAYGHAGAALRWTQAPWRLALGAELQQWQHNAATAGQTRNLQLVGEAAHALGPSLALVLRGQMVRRRMLGEVPMLYNVRAPGSTRSAAAVSVGLQAQF